jgi:hypothetical protein
VGGNYRIVQSWNWRNVIEYYFYAFYVYNFIIRTTIVAIVSIPTYLKDKIAWSIKANIKDTVKL